VTQEDAWELMMNWINVRDERPTAGEVVVASGTGFGDDSEPMVGVIEVDGDYVYCRDPNEGYAVRVDFWMRLPPLTYLTCPHEFKLNEGQNRRPFATESCVRCGLERSLTAHNPSA
jgi:hypothetical protein